MMDAPEAYKLVEGLAPGSWVAIAMEEGVVLASRAKLEELFAEVDNMHRQVQPLFLKVPDGMLHL